MITPFKNSHDDLIDISDMMNCGSLSELNSYDEFIFWETFGQEIHRDVRKLFNSDDEWIRIMNTQLPMHVIDNLLITDSMWIELRKVIKDDNAT